MCCWFLDRTASQAHPRSRGEHTHKELELDPANGSSPLARGTLAEKGRRYGSVRLIPARAGNIFRDGEGRLNMAAHPRSRGEHFPALPPFTPFFGSSPLARGTWVLGVCKIHSARLIPARAGNMREHDPRGLERPAHPRSRGEHTNPYFWYAWLGGSSPLARGTSASTQTPAHPPRLIPARAGNIQSAYAEYCLRSAHPRSRGEHVKYELEVIF